MGCRQRCCAQGVAAWIVADFSDEYDPSTAISIAAEGSWRIACNVLTLERLIDDVEQDPAPLAGCVSVCGGPVWLDIFARQPPGGNTIAALDIALSYGFTSGSQQEVDLRQVPADGTGLRWTARLAGPWFGISLFNADLNDTAKCDLWVVARNG